MQVFLSRHKLFLEIKIKSDKCTSKLNLGDIVATEVQIKIQRDELDLALSWASEHPGFDDSFLLSLEEYFDEHGQLTDKQHFALTNIINKWRMDE